MHKLPQTVDACCHPKMVCCKAIDALAKARLSEAVLQGTPSKKSDENHYEASLMKWNTPKAQHKRPWILETQDYKEQFHENVMHPLVLSKSHFGSNATEVRSPRMSFAPEQLDSRRVRTAGRTLLSSISQSTREQSCPNRNQSRESPLPLKQGNYDLMVRSETDRASSRGLPGQVPTAPQRRLGTTGTSRSLRDDGRDPNRGVRSRGSERLAGSVTDNFSWGPSFNTRRITDPNRSSRPRAQVQPIATLCRTACEPNSNYRAHMEDSSVVIDPFYGDAEDQWGFFAVYDGHGGRQAVDYCEQKLHSVLLDEVSGKLSNDTSDEQISEAFARTFRRMDDQLKMLGTWRCGCTVTVVLAHKMPSSKARSGTMRLHAANVGDSRAVVIDGSDVQRLSRDHRPTDPAEIQRVESEGGFVVRGRVVGQLGVSRALGDHSLKSLGVTWCPYVSAREVSLDSILVIGSDGLWDVLSDGDVRNVVDRAAAEGVPEKTPEMLIKAALRQGSTDNTTTLVSFFGDVKSFL